MRWMEAGVLPEWAALCAAVYAGVALGVLYDAFALLRLPLRGWWTAIADALYYAAALALTAAAMLYINCGAPRLYAFMGIALGAYVYARFPRRLFKELITKFTKKLLRRRA